MQILRQRLSQNTIALLLSNGGSAALAFGLSVLIGRLLGETGLGIYAAALAWILPLSMVTEFGLGTLITREVAQTPEAADAYLQVSVLSRLLIGGGLWLILWVCAPFLSPNMLVVQGIRLSSPLIIILPFYSSFTAIFRARQIMKPIAWLNLGMLLSQVLLTTLVLAQDGTILDVLAINVLTSSGQLIAAWIIYKKGFYAPSKKMIALVPLLRAAYPFAVAAILAAVQVRVVIIILEQATSAGEVGYYVAAVRFIEAGRMLPHAFFDAVFPLLAGLAATPHRFNLMFRRVLLGLVLFGVVFGVGMGIIGAPLITLTYGASFAPAIAILMVAAWSLLPMLLKGGRTLYWYAQGQEHYVNRITAIVIVLQVLLALWVIPQYGAIGAAGVSIIAETSAVVLLFIKRR